MVAKTQLNKKGQSGIVVAINQFNNVLVFLVITCGFVMLFLNYKFLNQTSHMSFPIKRIFYCLAALVLMAQESSSQSADTSLFSMLRWRMIGPHRGGRTVGAIGVPGQPNVFYIGVNNGGV